MRRSARRSAAIALAVFGHAKFEQQNYSASHAFGALDQRSPDWAASLDGSDRH